MNQLSMLPRFVVCTLLFLAFVAGCRSDEAAIPDYSTGSMKGYELYSWQDDDQQYFSLLVGTNREKSVEEIRSSDTALKGIKALEAALESIPAGQYVTWLGRETLSFPPEEVIRRVEEICKDQGLELAIVR